ncbi:hypothetical protein L9F63_005290, partial [Diploptera punctata]
NLPFLQRLKFTQFGKNQRYIILDMYLFNCTNTEELSRDFVPNFQEVGPYRFLEYQNKVDLRWNDNDTISYRQQRFFHFDEEASVSDMQENITMLNMPPVVASYKARDLGPLASFSLSVSMKILEKSVWVTKSVKEFLFEGYPDPLLTVSSIFSGDETSKVGFFYGRNGSFTFDGYFNMQTGITDLSKIGTLHQWNYANRTYRYDPGCDDVRGYLGHFFPPKITKEPFYFFSTDICKSVKLHFAEEVEVFGIKGYKFLPDDKLMDNGHTDPEKACDCVGDVCMAPGVLNLTGCLDGVPMYGSFPHFLGADSVYLKNTTGLSPDSNRSTFHVILEPTLGIPLELTAHLQYNTMLQRNPKLSLFEDVPDMVFPLFWVKKQVLINEEVAQKIKLILFLPTLGISCGIGSMLLGLIVIFVSLLPLLFKKTNQPPISKN